MDAYDQDLLDSCIFPDWKLKTIKVTQRMECSVLWSYMPVPKIFDQVTGDTYRLLDPWRFADDLSRKMIASMTWIEGKVCYHNVTSLGSFDPDSRASIICDGKIHHPYWPGPVNEAFAFNVPGHTEFRLVFPDNPKLGTNLFRETTEKVYPHGSTRVPINDGSDFNDSGQWIQRAFCREPSFPEFSIWGQ